jgi:hypothetical protein
MPEERQFTHCSWDMLKSLEIRELIEQGKYIPEGHFDVKLAAMERNDPGAYRSLELSIKYSRGFRHKKGLKGIEESRSMGAKQKYVELKGAIECARKKDYDGMKDYTEHAERLSLNHVKIPLAKSVKTKIHEIYNTPETG